MIKSRTPGSYTIIASYKDADGKRKQLWRTYHCNHKEAEQKLRELLTELDKGTFIRPGKITVADFLKNWLSDYIKPNLSPRTHELYKYITNNHILPVIGQVRLSDLKPQHLQRLYAQKQKEGLGSRTVQLIHTTLHKALRNAVKTGLLYRNITESVDTPKITKHEMHIMSEADIELFLDKAKETGYYPLFYCYLFTGCRRAELLNIHWQDIDLLLGQMSIKGSKTAGSRRLISLSPNTVAVLMEYREQQNKMRENLDLPLLTDADLVFCHADGSPIRPDVITHAWQKLVRKCDLAGVRLHDARHTHASLLLKQGVHPKIVQERLGHAGIAITLDLYSHISPGLQEAAAKKLDDLFSLKTVSKPLAKPENEKNGNTQKRVK